MLIFGILNIENPQRVPTESQSAVKNREQSNTYIGNRTVRTVYGDPYTYGRDPGAFGGRRESDEIRLDTDTVTYTYGFTGTYPDGSRVRLMPLDSSSFLEKPKEANGYPAFERT
ncbi:hypothetical protein DFH09DRAFT_1097203 [Mycena vulgaris]|nr:hypothetical protein DFH09DRAFT_1097203 [Mycena vulgaris]